MTFPPSSMGSHVQVMSKHEIWDIVIGTVVLHEKKLCALGQWGWEREHFRIKVAPSQRETFLLTAKHRLGTTRPVLCMTVREETSITPYHTHHAFLHR